jgi:hypothetical protein
MLRLLRMRVDVFQLGVDAAADQDAAVTTAAAAAAGEFALNDGGSCVRKLIVSLTPAAAAALVAGDAPVQRKLVNRVRAIIMHRSTSYSDDVLVACISSDEQVLAPRRRRIIALQSAILGAAFFARPNTAAGRAHCFPRAFASSSYNRVMPERRPSQQTLRFLSGGVQRAIAFGLQLPLLPLALLV